MNTYHIYCHIPFCKKRCKYCYFTAKYDEKEITSLNRLNEYVEALVNDIDKTDIPDWQLQSIVFGGGTPSLLNKEQLDKIMEKIKSKVGKNKVEQLDYIAYEVSPDTATFQTLKNFRDNGFNRISIGVQSFDDEVLRILGRPYGKKHIVDAMKNIRELKYDLVNIDLLIGTPRQTAESILNSVEETINLKPEHISVSLFYKSYPGGYLFVEEQQKRGNYIIGLEERMDVYEKVCNMLKDNGYVRVDNTVFSLPGFEYSYEQDSISGTKSVLAFGPGSSGYWNNKIRYTPPYIDKYIKNQESVNEEISIKTNAYATVWGHLNAYASINNDEIEKNFNMSIFELIESDNSISKMIDLLRKYDCIKNDPNTISLNRDKINKAIVIMHYDKDERGYKLITAPDNVKKQYE